MQDAKSINGGYPILTWQITTYEVTFTVTPEDAEVRIDGAKGKQNGNVWTFRLPEGTYSYTAFAFGYADESGNIEVSGAARKDITLTPVEKRTVRFSVTPEDAGAAVTVQWNGKTVAAEQDGSYRLPDGTYTYTVRAKGYAKVSQTLKVSGDVTVPVALEPSAAWDGQTGGGRRHGGQPLRDRERRAAGVAGPDGERRERQHQAIRRSDGGHRPGRWCVDAHRRRFP